VLELKWTLELAIDASMLWWDSGTLVGPGSGSQGKA